MGLRGPVLRDDAAVVCCIDIDADVSQFIDNGHHIIEPAVSQVQSAFCYGGSSHKCPRLDSVRNDGVVCRMQLFYAFDN